MLQPISPVAAPTLPTPRGPLSAELAARLAGPVQALPSLPGAAQQVLAAAPSVLDDEDLQLAVTLAYELHYQGWAGVDDRWEWQPDLVAALAPIEDRMVAELRQLVDAAFGPVPAHPRTIPAVLRQLTDADLGPSLSRHLARQGTVEEYRDFLIHRSVYHLKEADPHTFTIPRLPRGPKAALVEVQADEYGGGRLEWMHAALFADTMRGLDLDDSYAGYLDAVPAVTLAWANTMTLFGLHRRHRGKVAGHLAALEMTSSAPNRRYGDGLRRLGFGPEVTRFFDEHIEADAVHEQIACHDLAARLAELQPELAADIAFGAGAALVADAAVTRHLLSHWSSGTPSLRSRP